MPVKLRLARHGRKRFAFYHIVAADGRAPRDGKFIERVGAYNPNTNPATIELDFDKALDWLLKGAQPTETVRAILSYKGVLMKRHLLEGARKGAFSEEEAEKRFAAWLKEKEAKIQAKVEGLTQAMEDDIRQKLENETKVNEARAAAILKRQSKLAEAAARGDEPEEAADESAEVVEVAAEVTEELAVEAEETAVEESKEEKSDQEEVEAEVKEEEVKEEEVKEEVEAEVKEEEVKEEVEAEVKEEEPKEEAK